MGGLAALSNSEAGEALPLRCNLYLLKSYCHRQGVVSITYFVNKKVQLFQVLRRWPGREVVGAFGEGQVGLDGGFADL